MNLRGMGIGSRVIASAEDYRTALTAGHFWCTLLTGAHVSTDVAWWTARRVWWRHTTGATGHWRHVRSLDRPRRARCRTSEGAGAAAWARKTSCVATPAWQTSRPSADASSRRICASPTNGPISTVPAGSRRWSAACRPAMDLSPTPIAPDGYSVVLFGPHGPRYRHPPASSWTKCAPCRVFPACRSPSTRTGPEHHAMPPGGFRLAIVNCHDLRAGRDAREALRTAIVHRDLLAMPVRPDLHCLLVWHDGRLAGMWPGRTGACGRIPNGWRPTCRPKTSASSRCRTPARRNGIARIPPGSSSSSCCCRYAAGLSRVRSGFRLSVQFLLRGGRRAASAADARPADPPAGGAESAPIARMSTCAMHALLRRPAGRCRSAGRARPAARAAAPGIAADRHAARLSRKTRWRPRCCRAGRSRPVRRAPRGSVDCRGGMVAIGHAGGGFCFDNETPRHHVLLHRLRLAARLVRNRDWLDFIADGGYRTPTLWMSDGWAQVQAEGWSAPLYWRNDRWRPGGRWDRAGWRRSIPTRRCGISAGTRRMRSPAGRARGCRPRPNGKPRPRRERWTSMTGHVWQWTGSAYAPIRASARGGRGRRIQRQVHGQPDGVARRLARHAPGPCAAELSQLLPSRQALAVFRPAAGARYLIREQTMPDDGTHLFPANSEPHNRLGDRHRAGGIARGAQDPATKAVLR